MTMTHRRRLYGAIATIAALAAFRASPSLAGKCAGTGALACQPASITQTCFWGAPAGRPDGLNALAPDTNVTYYYSLFQLPAGASVVLNGRFPHSRFMSFTAYTTLNGQRGVALTHLVDADITPDAGSQNPFLPGAKRTSHRRRYTVTLSGDVDPGAGNGVPNTLYAGQAGLTGGTQTVELILRVYRPDRNYNLAGGVRLPKPTVVLADGTQHRRQAACDAVQMQSGFDKLSIAGIGLADATYASLLALGPPTHPAVDPIHFDRFFNQARYLEPFWRGTAQEGQIASLPSDLQPGLYPTPANAYVYGYADRTFGPDPDGHNILVLHGKLPTHATTFMRNPQNDYAGKQVRYWSLCNYGAIANPPLLPVNSDCLFDEEVPTDADGFYNIVVSLPEDRPANATEQCGVAWMDWGTAGDGLDRPRLINLLIRNQLSDPSFAEGADKVTTPDTEKRVMGDYLPDGSYMTKDQFEAQGCP